MEAPEENSWLIFADDSGLGERLAARLRAAGARCRVARRGYVFAATGSDAFTLRAEAPEDWKQLFEACAEDARRSVSSTCGPLDEPTGTSEPVPDGHRRACFTSLRRSKPPCPSAKLRIDLVTRGAQPVGRDMKATARGASSGHRVAARDPQRTPQLLLPRDRSARRRLPHRTIACSGMNCCATMPSARSPSAAKRAMCSASPAGGRTREQWLDPDVPLRLESRERGHLDTLRFAPFAAASLRAGRGADRSQSRGHEFPRRAQGACPVSRRSAGCAHLR